MKRPARITFSNPGTQPPVFVAGTLTSWEPLEMTVALERNKDGELVFYRDFEEVEEGEHQYKFRLGLGDWWAVDENAPKADDGSGNVNNLLEVKGHAVNVFGSVGSGPSSPTSPHPPNRVQSPIFVKEDAQPSSGETTPPPFIVVESVPSKNRPDYGDVDADSLHEDTSKRLADSKPDILYRLPESPLEKKSHSEAKMPTLVVEKTDDRPVHGDDFGQEATPGQKIAHKKRAADAEPDKVIVKPESSDSEADPSLIQHEIYHNKASERPETPEEDRAPLFQHESIENFSDEDEAPLLPHERASKEQYESPHATTDEQIKVVGGTHLFAHELPPHSSQSSVGSKSSTSLKEMMEREDLNDPSLEAFPTSKEDIYRHLSQVRARYPEDDDTRDSSSPSPRRNPSSPQASKHSSSVNLAHGLSPIDEDEDDSLETKLDSIAARSTEESLVSKDKSKDNESIEGLDELTTTVSEIAVKGAEDDQPELDRLDAPSSGALLTPPQTPIEGKSQARQDSVTDVQVPPVKSTTAAPEEVSSAVTSSTSGSRKTSMDSQDERAVTPVPEVAQPLQQKQKTYLQSMLHILFGSWLAPLGNWFAKLCGGKRNATGAAFASAVAVVAAVAYVYPPAGRK